MTADLTGEALEHVRTELELQARRRVRDESEAEELAQETIFRCLARRPDKASSVLPYARTVLSNLIRRQYHRSSWLVRLDELEERIPQDPRNGCAALESLERGFDELGDGELAELLRARTRMLPPDIRAVCEPHWFEGASYRSLASALGVDEVTARVRCHKGRRLLLCDPLVQLALGGPRRRIAGGKGAGASARERLTPPAEPSQDHDPRRAIAAGLTMAGVERVEPE